MSNPSKLRVIQWATGGVGKAAISCVLNHPQLELAGCWVHSADKNGRDVGEILGLGELGVTASNDIDDLLALDADCVMYSPLIPDDEEVIAILRSGKNVVTPVGWVYPDPDNPRHQAVANAAIEGGVTLHGSGIHPGGITERFPLMISGSVVGGHPRARRGVLRHPHLQRPGRGAPHYGVRRQPGGSRAGSDGEPARSGIQAIGANDRRPHGLSHRSQHQDHPGYRRGDRRYRLRTLSDHRRNRGRAKVPLASPGRRRAGDYGGSQLADG